VGATEARRNGDVPARPVLTADGRDLPAATDEAHPALKDSEPVSTSIAFKVKFRLINT